MTMRIFTAKGLMCGGCGVTQRIVACAWARRDRDDTVLGEPGFFLTFLHRSFRLRHARCRGSIIVLATWLVGVARP